MWQAIKSDLSDFVNTISEDAENTLQSIDSKLQRDESSEDDVNNGVILDEYGNAVILDDGSETKGQFRDLTNFEMHGEISSAADEVAWLRSLKETYSVPLLPTGEDDIEDDIEEDGSKDNDDKEKDSGEKKNETKSVDESYEPIVDFTILDDEEIEEIQYFISSFSMQSYSPQIEQVLERYDETTKVFHEMLVPDQVSERNFWMRYFYRCDLDRVEYKWESEKVKARQELIQNGISSVKNFFGGAVKAVATASQEIDTHMENYEQALNKENEAQANGGGIAGVFLRNRPPFVMNTRVDDNDVDDDEEEYESEEELGWDDDEEDEEENNSQNDEKIHQLEQERDSLQATIKMQSSEIEELQQKLAVFMSPTDESEETVVEQKLKLIEKESELRAIKESIDIYLKEHGGDSETQGQNYASIVTQITNEFTSKKSEIVNLNAQMDKMKMSFEKTEQELKDEVLSLKAQLVAVNNTVASNENTGSEKDNEQSFSSGEKVGKNQEIALVEDDDNSWGGDWSD